MTTTVINKATYQSYIFAVKKLLSRKDSLLAPYIAYVINSLRAYSPVIADHLLEELIERYPDNEYVTDAIISGLQGREDQFLHKFPDTTTRFHQRLEQLMKKKIANEKNHNIKKLEKEYPKGYAIFNTVCQTCHGADGNGIKFLAPPLNGSNWVLGDKNKLISIVLYGLTGAVKVSGETYKKPEVIGDMPEFGNNDKFYDSALAELLSFIRHAWSNQTGEVNENDILNVRHQFKGREKSFTVGELKKVFPEKERK